jgi:hypothetical protein
LTEASDYQVPLIVKSQIEKPTEKRKLDDYENADYVSSSDEDEEMNYAARDK